MKTNNSLLVASNIILTKQQFLSKVGKSTKEKFAVQMTFPLSILG